MGMINREINKSAQVNHIEKDKSLMNDEKERLLRYMADRAAATRTSYIASAVKSYLESHPTISRDDLINWLGITPERLTRLELCLRPDKANAQRYSSDITAVAAAMEIDPIKLKTILEDIEPV